MSATRQLAAILFTDIVGYSVLMQQDEHSAIRLVKHHRVVLKNTVAGHEGDVIDYYGDGSLCIFTSITKAVECAVSIQKQLREDPVVPLRIGLHIGEVVFDFAAHFDVTGNRRAAKDGVYRAGTFHKEDRLTKD